MKDKEKIQLFDQITELIKTFTQETEKDIPKIIGTLNKPIKINGFKPCDIGTPVFEHQDRYILVFENLNGDKSFEMKYHKNLDFLGANYEEFELKNIIDFKDIP